MHSGTIMGVGYVLCGGDGCGWRVEGAAHLESHTSDTLHRAGKWNWDYYGEPVTEVRILFGSCVPEC